MPNDKWGLPFIYPTKKDGFTWFQKDDIDTDSHWEAEDHMSNVGGGSFTINYSGPTSGVIYSDPNFVNTNAIGGCNMDFSDTEARGYTYKPADLKNFELKFIMSTDLDGGFSVSQTAGRHSGSGCCSGFAYMINMECNTDPVEFRFRKEMWHVSYHTDPETGDFTHNSFNFKLNDHGNIGICFVKYLKTDSVVLEFWANPDPDDDPENWIKVKTTEDNGGWGDDGDDCGGDKDQIGLWGTPKWRLKSNSEGSITFKHMSLREIDPNSDFDTPPPTDGGSGGSEPPPVDQPATSQTVKGSFVLKRNVNIQTSNPCSLSGYKTFYLHYITINDEIPLCDDPIFQDRTRIGERCVDTSSEMFGKVIKQFDVMLRSEGSPASSPVVTAEIRNSSDSLKYTSPTNLDPSTLTGLFQLKTFDFSTNTYTMQTGDRVYIRYTGSDENNYVVAGSRENVAPGSCLTKYEEFGTSAWNNNSSADLPAIMWEA